MLKQWLHRLKDPNRKRHKVLGFIWRVLLRFFWKNNGLLLSGAVAYNTLLSMIPLCAVILVLLSHFVDEHQLLNILHAELALLIPGQANTIVQNLQGFLNERELIGIVGFVVLLFFSTIAFRIFENAMAVIFGTRMKLDRRHFWVSAILPYAFIALIGVGLLGITIFTAIINAIADSPFVIFAYEISLDRFTGILLYLVGIFSLLTLFTSLYMVMPPIKVQFKRALVGALLATLLWEITRYILTWYFTTISLVNLIYGSLATVIIVLLTMEIAAIIVLIGAQIIAELEHNAANNLKWYDNADAVNASK